MSDDDDFLDSIADAIIAQSEFWTSTKKPRGLNAHSQWLLKHMIPIVEAAQPITGRGVGYKMFVKKLIKSMSESEMKKVYRLLKIARERSMIPWEYIVDETRRLERKPSWKNPKAFLKSAILQYRRDFWEQQPERCEVWSEKGTVRGVLQPALDKYGVGFRAMHGYGSATVVNDIASIVDDARPLTALYVGDWDPSGLHMSEIDLPERLEDYGGGHVKVLRVALTEDQLTGLPSFPAATKLKDPRYSWELDALDPNELRGCVEDAIEDCILNREAWERCETVQRAEAESLRHGLASWPEKDDLHGKPTT